jgi:hypothetical protein
MGKRSKSKKDKKGDLFDRIYLFLFGVVFVVGGVFLGKELFVTYCETDSIWFYLIFAALSVFMILWGVVVIVSCFLSENSRFRRAVDAIGVGDSGAPGVGVVLLVFAVPVYFLLKFIRRMSYEDDSD